EGKPGAVEDPGVDVTPELVDAEPVSVRWARAAAAGDQNEVLVLRPTVGKQRGEEREGDEREDKDETENRRRISDQPPEGVVPEPAGPLVEADLLGFDLGDAHE